MVWQPWKRRRYAFIERANKDKLFSPLNRKFHSAFYLTANLHIHKFGNEDQFDAIFFQKSTGHDDGFERLVYSRGADGLHANLASLSHYPGDGSGNFGGLG
jgi:hypothetical protein